MTTTATITDLIKKVKPIKSQLYLMYQINDLQVIYYDKRQFTYFLWELVNNAWIKHSKTLIVGKPEAAKAKKGKK